MSWVLTLVARRRRSATLFGASAAVLLVEHSHTAHATSHARVRALHRRSRAKLGAHLKTL